MKKQVLIVINGMELGGAQKSLISFLRCLEQSPHAADYDIDLMVAKPKGLFYRQIPAFVRLIPPPPTLLWLATPRTDELLQATPSLMGRIGKLRWILSLKQTLLHRRLNEEQRLWTNWKPLIPRNPKHYDVAVSYMNGFPGYYVIDKVQADKKVLWVHNDYQELGYDVNWDRPYYMACDQVITISRACVDSFCQVFPELAGKAQLLENITIPEDILSQGQRDEAPEYGGCTALRLLSIGRLDEQKQFDLAIRTAAELRERSIDFKWLIVGDGPDREALQEMINSLQLQAHVLLVGLRDNPYAYLSRCDIFVQTSRFEGRSLVLDEARIFCKPMVVTDYPTARDAVRDGETGLICPMQAKPLADAIERVAHDAALRVRLQQPDATPGNLRELEKYISLML